MTSQDYLKTILTLLRRDRLKYIRAEVTFMVGNWEFGYFKKKKRENERTANVKLQLILLIWNKHLIIRDYPIISLSEIRYKAAFCALSDQNSTWDWFEDYFVAETTSGATYTPSGAFCWWATSVCRIQGGGNRCVLGRWDRAILFCFIPSSINDIFGVPCSCWNRSACVVFHGCTWLVKLRFFSCPYCVWVPGQQLPKNKQREALAVSSRRVGTVFIVFNLPLAFVQETM